MGNTTLSHKDLITFLPVDYSFGNVITGSFRNK